MADIFDEIQKKLQKAADEVSGNHDINEIFTPEFMRNNTEFNDIAEFFEKSPFDVKNQEDLSQLPEEELSEFVGNRTDYTSWDEFKAEAGKAFALKKFKEQGF